MSTPSDPRCHCTTTGLATHDCSIACPSCRLWFLLPRQSFIHCVSPADPFRLEGPLRILFSDAIALHHCLRKVCTLSFIVCRQWLWSSVVGTALPCGSTRAGLTTSHPCVRDGCKQGFHRHMSNNTGFMNFAIEIPLTSTVQSSLDPLSVNDPWASAVAVRPVQQQHQTQVPFLSQLQETEFWPQTGQPQQWSTPRLRLGLTGPPPTTLQGMSSNDWQSPLPPPPTWDANAPGFGSGDGGRQDASWTGWNSSGKGYKGNAMPFMEISDRDPTPKWDFQETGARLRPWLRELSFWRHDTSTPMNKQGVKLYKALPLGTIGRSLADQFSEDQICSGQGFDLIIGAIRYHFRSCLEPEPEVQAEIALYQTARAPKGTFVEYTSRISNKLREMESGFKRSIYISKADKMVDALNRLDQTDALVEQTLGDRTKLEHHANRGHAQSNSHAQAYPMEVETTTSTESNHDHNHKAASDTESDQLYWDPEKLMMTVIPWWTKTGPLWCPYHGKDLWMKRVR